ncbi:hypothetical protein GCM10023082_36140 [Streptomyces tremellae]|uniref:Uncharacterized protein n=1 Tax=Streptomyces tremellae TaxID=1124239 RepID=A0ABP7FBP9_9ACTN
MRPVAGIVASGPRISEPKRRYVKLVTVGLFVWIGRTGGGRCGPDPGRVPAAPSIAQGSHPVTFRNRGGSRAAGADWSERGRARPADCAVRGMPVRGGGQGPTGRSGGRELMARG